MEDVIKLVLVYMFEIHDSDYRWKRNIPSAVYIKGRVYSSKVTSITISFPWIYEESFTVQMILSPVADGVIRGNRWPIRFTTLTEISRSIVDRRKRGRIKMWRAMYLWRFRIKDQTHRRAGLNSKCHSEKLHNKSQPKDLENDRDNSSVKN